MPRETEFFEDLVVDEEEMGTFTLSDREIIEFAEQFDPLPFHTDPDVAERSIFGGLVASGHHTTVETNRVLVENHFQDSAMQGALGIDNLRWKAPVRPGDQLTVNGVIKDKQDFNDRLGLGHGKVAVTNQAGETVLSMIGKLLFRKRGD